MEADTGGEKNPSSEKEGEIEFREVPSPLNRDSYGLSGIQSSGSIALEGAGAIFPPKGARAEISLRE